MIFLVEKSNSSHTQTNTTPSILCKPTSRAAGGVEPQTLTATMAPSNEELALFPDGPLANLIKAQQVHSTGARFVPAFYRNIEESLDARRATQSLFSTAQDLWQTHTVVDFASNDSLSRNTSGFLRSSFLEELSRYPDFRVGASASKVGGGSYPYLDETELETASFHGVEAGILVNSAFDANVMLWAAIPRPGDVIMCDNAVHASTHEGMHRSVAIQKVEF